jgi:hypothetical protein
MATGDEAGSGAGADDVEWLDVGRPLPDSPGRAPAPRWRWWYALLALVLLAAAVSAIRTHDAKHSASPSPSRPSPSPTLPSQPSLTDQPSGPEFVGPDAPIPPTVSVSEVGHPLLDVDAGWTLYGLASGSVFQIQLASGRITETPTPLLDSANAASFIIGRSGVIIAGGGNEGAGAYVPDGQSARTLPSAYGQSGEALAGPDPDHVWVPTATGSAVRLVGFTSGQSDTTITLPSDLGSLTSDGAGYVLFAGTSGWYDARPGKVQRVTTGNLLAVGPTKWLVADCDDSYRCSTVVVDQATGARHTLAAPADAYVSGGAISPDGQTAAVLRSDAGSPAPLHLIDLNSGADRATSMTFDTTNVGVGSSGLLVWSPDSKWIFATNGIGRLYAINAATGNVTVLGANLGPIGQIALRSTG